MESDRASIISTRNGWGGAKDHDLVKALLENTQTESGLSVKANVIFKAYEKGKKARTDLYDQGTIIFDKILRKLNYKVVPAYQ